MSEPETIQEARTWASRQLREEDVEHPGLTADLLLAHCLDVPRLKLPLREEEFLSEETWTRFRSLVGDRREGTPLAYITEQADFFGRTFHVDKRALIPRPETERLVEGVLSRLPDQVEREAEGRTGRVCDLGVGSGVILHTICLERPEMDGLGVDISSDALELARENARKHGLEDRVELVEGDVLDPETVDRLEREGPFDVVVSNPPYISPEEMEELEPKVREQEPDTALVTPVERTTFFRNLITLADRLTVEGGCFAMEMSETDHPDPEDVKGYTAFSSVGIEVDHRGMERLFFAEKTA